MVGALSDLKIVELGEMVSAPYCTKLFADLGADVVKIEPPARRRSLANPRSLPQRRSKSGEERPLPLSQHQQARRHPRCCRPGRLRDLREVDRGRRRPGAQPCAARDGSHRT